MKTLIPVAFSVLLCCACSSARRSQAPDTLASSPGHTRTKAVTFIDETAYELTEPTTDKTYGYEKSNPINVGGASEQSGPLNERRFLNGLSGPNGETVQYHRIGSCCAFKTPNGFSNMGLLDRYKVYWEGCTDTAILYINMYDKGDLKVPVGFKAKSMKWQLGL
jgi:hypothetical protein